MYPALVKPHDHSKKGLASSTQVVVVIVVVVVAVVVVVVVVVVGCRSKHLKWL